MELTARLVRFGFTRPRTLLAVAPGATGVRLGMERELRERGWRCVASPADADLLVVCGSPAAALAEAVDRTWEQMTAPRARIALIDSTEVGSVLDEGRRALLDLAAQREQGAGRDNAAAGKRTDSGEMDHSAMDSGGMDHSAMGSGGMDHGEMDHSAMDHGGHEGHGSMEIAGLAMADRGEDRDGLKLDQLHVQFGPVLPDWPAGLVLRVTLQGDVIQEAEVEVLPSADEADGLSFWEQPWRTLPDGDEPSPRGAARWRAAAHLDSLGRLLAVAGWEGAALSARRLRDDLLADAPAEQVAAAFAPLTRRLQRSRLLRAMTRDLGVLTREQAESMGVQGPALRAGGDVAARMTQWLAETTSALRGAGGTGTPNPHEGPRGEVTPDGSASAALMEAAVRMVRGLDVAGARLVVASLDPDTDVLARSREQEPAGG